MGVIRVLAATGRAIVGWAVGVAIGLGAGATVAWIANTWNSYRWGVPIGLLAFVIMFWGLVGGIFLIGPALAVWAARRRPGHLLSGEDGTEPFHASWLSARVRRHTGALIIVGSIGVVAGAGAVGVCGGLRWAPCRGFPPHEVEGSGDIVSVLASPDGTRYTYVEGLGPGSTIEILARGSTQARPLETGGSPHAFSWMPDAERLAVVAGDAFGSGTDRLLIVSVERGVIERSIDLPWGTPLFGTIAVSPDGGSVLMTSDPASSGARGGLYRVDLQTGTVRRIAAPFEGVPKDPLFLDDSHAVVVDAWYARSALRLVDLVSGSTRTLSPAHLNVGAAGGWTKDGDVVFSAFPASLDPNVSTPENFEHPVIARVSLDTGAVHELFEPGVASRLRMTADGLHAVAIADTCTGDCGNVKQLWELDLTRYVG
jgi:hypothetical protein